MTTPEYTMHEDGHVRCQHGVQVWRTIVVNGTLMKEEYFCGACGIALKPAPKSKAATNDRYAPSGQWTARAGSGPTGNDYIPCKACYAPATVRTLSGRHYCDTHAPARAASDTMTTQMLLAEATRLDRRIVAGFEELAYTEARHADGTLDAQQRLRRLERDEADLKCASIARQRVYHCIMGRNR